MASVIDREKQYFIAEATKTLKLSDTSKCEQDGDGLWVGCSTVDKQGRLCEQTIELPVVPGKVSCFTVTDLSSDKRFNQLPFVTGAPYFKFYAGTPLTTKKGINIGSFFILDDEVRPNLTQDQEEFLNTLAQIAMKHMETTSEAEERKKIMRMSMGLNAFVEGNSHLHFRSDRKNSRPPDKSKRSSKLGTNKPPDSPNRIIVDASPRLLQNSWKRSPESPRAEGQRQHASASATISSEGQKPHPGRSTWYDERKS